MLNRFWMWCLGELARWAAERMLAAHKRGRMRALKRELQRQVAWRN